MREIKNMRILKKRKKKKKENHHISLSLSLSIYIYIYIYIYIPSRKRLFFLILEGKRPNKE